MQDKLTLIKYIGNRIQKGVILTDLAMTLYVLWLIITNDSSWIPGILFGFTPFGAWMLLEANRLFGFCLIHRLMIYHIFLVYMCCVYQAYIGFGDLLYPARWIMFISGLFLFIRLLYELKKCSFRISEGCCG